MKILLIHNYYRFRGGEDRYVNILKNILEKNGHQVILFCSDSRGINEFSLLKKWLIPVRLLNSPAVNRELEKCLAEEKPDLAVVHNLAPLLSLSILKVLRRNNVPILKRLENYKFLCLNGLFLRNDFTVCEKCKNGNFWHGIRYRCYQRSSCKSLGIALSEWYHRRKKTVQGTADLFLATSQFVKSKFVEAGFPGERIEVHPNFIDFDPLESVRQPGPYAIFVGRLSEEKGLLTLLKAFKELPDLPLKILGGGPLEKKLKEFADRNKMQNVEFAGFIDGQQKKDLLAGARFLIFSSECYESFGYSIIESFACGVPVIASDIGGARELVTEGQTGFLFEPGNPGDLVKNISRMSALEPDALKTMKENALTQAKEFYTGERGYQNLVELFDKINS